MVDYDAFLDGSYYYNGVKSASSDESLYYVLLIRKSALLYSLAVLHTESSDPGYAKLRDFIENEFGEQECFEDWHILGDRDLFGHMGETGNNGYAAHHWSAIAGALERGDAIVLDSHSGRFIETLHVMDSGVFPGSTEYRTPDGTRIVVTMSGFESPSPHNQVPDIPTDGPRYHR